MLILSISVIVKVFGRRPSRTYRRARGRRSENLQRTKPRVGTKDWFGESSYGDFAAGSGFDVVERSGSRRDSATPRVRELGREQAAQRLCDAILRFGKIVNGDFDMTAQGITLSAWSQHGR